jgi:lysophospholipid acyltransferase (LPLAT)-like uncharacterized protein
MRWQVEDWNILESIQSAGRNTILAFWHGRIFTATYYFRGRGIVVMISQNRDGEYISKVIRHFGYGVVRGSSSRRSIGATVEMLREIKRGKDIGFAMDGPRGPRYAAKPGAAYIARKSGNPVVPFNISVEKKWTMKSWDHFQVPFPFSRAVVLIGQPIYVAADAGDAEIEACEQQIQNALDELRDRGDHYFSRQSAVGSGQKPFYDNKY